MIYHQIYILYFIIKHDLLIDRLKIIGLSDTVLLWFISYLKNKYIFI